MAQPNGQINAFNLVEDNDNNSSFDEKSLLTALLSSSIYNYEVENGRTYYTYKASKYIFPNNEDEKERINSTFGPYFTDES